MGHFAYETFRLEDIRPRVRPISAERNLETKILHNSVLKFYFGCLLTTKTIQVTALRFLVCGLNGMKKTTVKL